MDCCASSLRLQHGAGAKITYVPGRGFSFADMTPLLRIWQGDGNADSPLLTVGLTETPKGSRFVIADGSLLLEITAGDAGDIPVADDVFFDITLADVSGFVSPFVGGAVDVDADGSQGPSAASGSVTVALNGLQVPVVIQGGSLGPAMATAISDLNIAVSEAEAAASTAEAAKNETLGQIDTRLAKAQNGADFADVGAVLGNLTVTQSGAGAVARPASAKLGDTVNAKDYGVKADGATDDTASLQAAITANPGATIELPAGTVRLGQVGITAAGTRIVGAGRYGTIIKPIASLNAGEAIFRNPNAGTNSTAYLSFERLRFRFDGQDVVGIDLSSINNAVVDQCFFAGSEAGASQIGVGVRFGSPMDQASYSNHVRDCAFYSLAKGVEYLVNANSNMVTGGECIYCVVGVDAAPTGHLDTPRVIGVRFEGGGIGIKEKSVGANYVACRFEDNSVADIDFIDNGAGDQSIRPMVLGGYTATTVTSLRNPSNAVSPVIMAPDMGRYDVEASTNKKQFFGRHVFAAYTTAINPTVPSGIEYAAYFYDSPIIRNSIPLEFGNAAGTGSVISVGVDSSNQTTIRSFNRATSTDGNVLLGAGPAVLPFANNVTDLGSNAVRYKDGFFFGDLFANDISIDGIIYINGVPVLGPRSTGWTAMTGTGSKGALAAAAAGTASGSYVQAELQAALNRLAAVEARLKAYDDVFFANGTIGA